MKVRDLAILSFPTTEDLSEKEGYVVIADGTAGNVKLATAADGTPVGVITTPADGTEDNVSVAVTGFAGTVRVKLGAACDAFESLTLMADGTVEGAGAGTIVAKAMESGVADELVEAVLVAAITTDAASVTALDTRLDAIDTAETGTVAVLAARVTVLEGA